MSEFWLQPVLAWHEASITAEQRNRLIVVVVIDHSRAAPSALPWGCPTDLPHAAGSRHQLACFRVSAEVRHQAERSISVKMAFEWFRNSSVSTTAIGGATTIRDPMIRV